MYRKEKLQEMSVDTEIDMYSVLELNHLAKQCLNEMERAEAAERRAEVAEKALGLACVDFKEEYDLFPDSKTVSYMIDNYSKKAEQALKEGNTNV